LVTRNRERLESDIADYLVIERDGTIIGCAAMHAYTSDRMGELACLVLHQQYRGEKRGEELLQRIEDRAVSRGLDKLFALTTRTAHWFRERGFVPADVADLPESRRASYSPSRNSKVLIKSLR
jgi:amino-acid N-acetyltransferase